MAQTSQAQPRDRQQTAEPNALRCVPAAEASMTDVAQQRDRLLERLAHNGITDARVLAAIRAVPRAAFVPSDLQSYAYEDVALPIEGGQTISQPTVVAGMLQAAAIPADGRVLEVGAGSGYLAAVASRLAGQVFAIERYPELAERAAARLRRLGLSNVSLRCGDGALGWPEAAPFDAIIVSAAGPIIPPALLDQLRLGGRLIMPLGERLHRQRLICATREAADHFRHEALSEVAFVPLIGPYGWSLEQARDRPDPSDHEPVNADPELSVKPASGRRTERQAGRSPQDSLSAARRGGAREPTKEHTMRDVMPWARSAPTRWRQPTLTPFGALRQEMNRLFDEMFTGMEPLRAMGFEAVPAWPKVEMADTEQEIRVTAELPGLEEGDVQVEVIEGALRLSGEFRSESEDRERRYSERQYGRFERLIPLPQDVEAEKAQASFRNGVLRVSLPKAPDSRRAARRIPISSGAEGAQ